jgi:hypothetical protein
MVDETFVHSETGYMKFHFLNLLIQPQSPVLKTDKREDVFQLLKMPFILIDRFKVKYFREIVQCQKVTFI